MKKKILIVLSAFAILFLSVYICDLSKKISKNVTNNEKKDDVVISNVVVTRKLYESKVPAVLHDDVFNYVSNVSYELNESVETNELVIVSDNLVLEDNLVLTEDKEDSENKLYNDSEVLKTDTNEKKDVNISDTNNDNENNIDISKIKLGEETTDDKNVKEIDIPINEEEILLDELINNEMENIKKTATEVKNGYYSPSGKYLGESNVKVIDVSYYQGDINWDTFVRDGDFYGVILRLGYWNILDKKFERNISEIKRLNIPYGIYLFSYSSTINGATIESNFTNQMIDKYDLKPSLGIYYDIESWNTNTNSSNNISKELYDNIVTTYVNNVSMHIDYAYKVKLYSGRWYAMNRLGDTSKAYVDWVAEYNSTCKYNGPYSMWQYTSKGRVPGINGNVDISYLL